MRESARERLAGALYAVGLLDAAQRVRDRHLTRRAANGDRVGPDGLPLPPARLRVAVDGRSGDADKFMLVGDQSARRVRESVGSVGIDLADLGSILDFGCGCGRVTRYWAQLDGPEIHGCDVNPELVAWCSQNLPFMRAVRTEVEPPTSYESDSFDLVYALSVLTHLPEALQLPWMSEFRRILRPGGVLVFTTLGESAKARASRQDRADFAAGRLVVNRPDLPGSNLCIALHPYEYVASRLLEGFTLLSFTNGPPTPGGQDTYVARVGDA